MIGDKDSNVVFVYNTGSSRDKSANDLKAIGNLLLLTGRIIKENNGIILLKDNSNSAGLLDMGGYTGMPARLCEILRYKRS